jgi:hypothetical protein
VLELADGGARHPGVDGPDTSEGAQGVVVDLVEQVHLAFVVQRRQPRPPVGPLDEGALPALLERGRDLTQPVVGDLVRRAQLAMGLVPGTRIRPGALGHGQDRPGCVDLLERGRDRGQLRRGRDLGVSHHGSNIH